MKWPTFRKVNNNLLGAIILVEIACMIIFLRKSELLKEELEFVWAKNGNSVMKMTAIGIVIAICMVSYAIAYILKKYYKFNMVLVILFILINVVLLIEYKLSTNLHYTNTFDDLKEALDNSTTGDFVFFRSYQSSDLSHFAMIKWFGCILCKQFFAHMGMIVKINNVPYLLELNTDPIYCHYSKTTRTGVNLVDAYERIKHFHGRVYLSKNNLHEYIQESDLFEYMDKYRHLQFMKDNIMCTTVLTKCLSCVRVFNKNHKYIYPYDFLFPCDFNDPDIYTVDFVNTENVQIKNDYYYKHEV
jgi:hypothetical protein